MQLTRQSWTAVIATVLFVVLIAATALAPVPFVLLEPGRVVMLSGQGGAQPTLTVSGAPTYPHQGGQVMAPLASLSPAEDTVSLPEAWIGFLRDDTQVLRRSVVYPLSSQNTESQVDQAQQLGASQSDAVVAVLREAGIPVTPRPVVTQVSTSGPAYGRMEVGDAIISINDTAVEYAADAIQMVQQFDPGAVVRVKLIRDQVVLSLDVTTVAAQESPHLATLGLDLRDSYSHSIQVDTPDELSDAGAQSGLALAIALYDQLVPESVIDGHQVAAAGSVSALGEVSSVTGARQMVVSAQANGAQIMLLPANNCADIEGLDHSLMVIRVTKLSDAIASLESLTDPTALGQVPLC